jgi:hypothetical protein
MVAEARRGRDGGRRRSTAYQKTVKPFQKSVKVAARARRGLDETKFLYIFAVFSTHFIWF